MADHGLEHVDIAVGALGREIAALLRAGVEHLAGALRGTANGASRASGTSPSSLVHSATVR